MVVMESKMVVSLVNRVELSSQIPARPSRWIESSDKGKSKQKKIVAIQVVKYSITKKVQKSSLSLSLPRLLAMASLNPTNVPTDQVLVEENSYIRTLILNRPRQLNALSHPMVSRLLELFLAYEDDPTVKLIILKGKGRAFCAGGDVSAVARVINEGHWRLGANFFWDEFRLNYLMATYSKPQVSILNGLVLGGGAGASIHGRFRIATENSVFAMPETALGLFPDVGASYFLSRLPGFFGEYLGLTGTRLDGAEILVCGLATHFVPAAKLDLLEEALCKLNTSDPAIVSTIIDEFAQRPSVKEKSSCHRLAVIDRCFSRRTVEEILAALEEEAVNRMDDWFSRTIGSLKVASPTSLKITLRSGAIPLKMAYLRYFAFVQRPGSEIREGRLQGIGQCLIREYRICCHVLKKEVSKDFFEGCRAILVDKDKSPKWEPSKLELVSEEMVDRYFTKVDEEGWEDLKLPVRRNVPTNKSAKL